MRIKNGAGLIAPGAKKAIALTLAAIQPYDKNITMEKCLKKTPLHSKSFFQSTVVAKLGNRQR